MPTVDQQTQINLCVIRANELSLVLPNTYFRYNGNGFKSSVGGDLVPITASTQFKNLVKQYIIPLYSSPTPLATDLYQYQSNFDLYSQTISIWKGSKMSGRSYSTKIFSLSNWNKQYIAWSITLPTVLDISGVKSNNTVVIFSEWYNKNIVPLLSKISFVNGGK